MLGKLAAWIIGKEPVATATGLAALVTAALGVAAAFGVGITPEQIAAVAALAAALAGYLGRRAVTPILTPRRSNGDTGSVPLALIILVVFGVLLVGAFFASCDALFEDEDEVNDLGITVTEQAYHEECDPEWGDCGGGRYEQDYGSYDRNRNRERNRGAFSPGPFDRSPIDFSGSCFSLDCSGYQDRERDPNRRDDPGYRPDGQVPS